MFTKLATLVVTLAAAVAAVAAPPTNESYIEKRDTILKPVMQGVNFPDPAIIRVGNNFFGYATQGKVDGKRVHVQVAQSINDFEHWTHLRGRDALPKLPNWVASDNPHVWAPDVIRLDNGKYVMYYSATLKKKKKLHCVGVAFGNNPLSPFTPGNMHEQPYICNEAAGGAIDPAGYFDPKDNTRWVVYKVDGNAVGYGGVCNNGVKPIVSTPIKLQQVRTNDGVTKIGAPIQLITNGPADGPVVEAPSLSRMDDGTYVLFLSSNCFATPHYDVDYATARNIKGPYTKYGPMFVTGTMGLHAPGGLDLAINGIRAVFHADYNGGRAMYTAIIGGSGNKYHAYVKNR